MIRLSDGKIGIRELFSLIMITLLMKLTDTTPTLLFGVGQTAGWWLPLITGSCLSLSLLVLLSVLKRHPNKGLLELIFGLTGPYVGFLLGLSVFAIYLSVVVVNSRSYIDIINTMIFQKTPLPALYLMVMGAACYVASLGLETIGRVARIILPYVIVMLLILVLIVWHSADWLHIFPLAGPGIGRVVKEGVLHSAIFGEVLYMTALIPLVRAYKDFRKAAWLGFVLSVMALVVALFLYVAVFGYPTVREIIYPFQQLARTAQIGQVVTNLDSIFFFFWQISTVVHFAIYLYIATYFLAGTLQIADMKPLILPIAGLIVLLGLIGDNISKLNEFRAILLPIYSMIYLLFPLLLWLLDWWKRRRTP